MLKMTLFWATKFPLVAIASCAAAIQQVRHDASFQPDHILRVGEEVKAVACRSKLTAVVNGKFKLSARWHLIIKIKVPDEVLTFE